MDFYLGRSDWKTLQRGEEHSFLLVNGLGGYCSQTVICSNARHDHNLLTAALVAPTKRFAMVRRIEDILHVGRNAYRLDSQAYVCLLYTSQFTLLRDRLSLRHRLIIT